MLRVPGSRGDLLTLKSRGADVRVVYSPLDAVRSAPANPERRVVFFGISFETTAPANAMAVYQAKRQRAWCEARHDLAMEVSRGFRDRV